MVRRFDIGWIIVGVNRLARGAAGLSQRYTRREVGRILGVDSSRLRYWERLRLVRPRARWGERFYSFGDLVALRTLQRLIENRIPAQRVRRAVKLVEQQLGATSLPLQELRFVEQGRDVLVIPPGADRPFSPLKQQWVFSFDSVPLPARLHSMMGRPPEELFQAAIDCEANEDTLPAAIENYRRVIEVAPNWIEAHINLGVALYQLGRVDEAHAEFIAAVQIDPQNGISRYNLGCVLEEKGELDEAVRHLRRAARVMPGHADVRFNLALAYEKRGQRHLAREQWKLYLRHAPNGPWASQARARLRHPSLRRSAPIPFPSKR